MKQEHERIAQQTEYQEEAQSEQLEPFVSLRLFTFPRGWETETEEPVIKCPPMSFNPPRDTKRPGPFQKAWEHQQREAEVSSTMNNLTDEDYARF